MITSIFSVVLVLVMTALLFARPVRVDMPPKTKLTTYDAPFVENDIIIPHKTTCSLEDAIIGAQDSRAMALNIISILSK